jgi:hypothetical protein
MRRGRLSKAGACVVADGRQNREHSAIWPPAAVVGAHGPLASFVRGVSRTDARVCPVSCLGLRCALQAGCVRCLPRPRPAPSAARCSLPARSAHPCPPPCRRARSAPPCPPPCRRVGSPCAAVAGAVSPAVLSSAAAARDARPGIVRVVTRSLAHVTRFRERGCSSPACSLDGGAASPPSQAPAPCSLSSPSLVPACPRGRPCSIAPPVAGRGASCVAAASAAASALLHHTAASA